MRTASVHVSTNSNPYRWYESKKCLEASHFDTLRKRDLDGRVALLKTNVYVRSIGLSPDAISWLEERYVCKLSKPISTFLHSCLSCYSGAVGIATTAARVKSCLTDNSNATRENSRSLVYLENIGTNVTALGVTELSFVIRPLDANGTDDGVAIK